MEAHRRSYAILNSTHRVGRMMAYCCPALPPPSSAIPLPRPSPRKVFLTGALPLSSPSSARSDSRCCGCRLRRFCHPMRCFYYIALHTGMLMHRRCRAPKPSSSHYIAFHVLGASTLVFDCPTYYLRAQLIAVIFRVATFFSL